jgi:hypothetical protein
MNGTETNATGSGCPSQLVCSLYRNDSAVSNPDVDTLAVGNYTYIYNTTGNENYSNASVSETLNVSAILMYCGDGSCNNGETCSSCSADCGSCGGGCVDTTWTCAGWGACVGDVQTRVCTSNCGTGRVETKCCSVNWTCSEWTNCTNNRQERDCKSNCGTDETETRACESCVPNWQCTDFGNCTSQGVKTRECTDANNCNTEAGKPDESVACEYGRLCVPRIYCTNWGECVYVDKVSDILGGGISYTGYQERVCYDKNLCAENYTEYQNCTSGVEIEIIRETICGEEVLTAINKNTRTPVTTLNLETLGPEKADVSFIQSSARYCPSCYNGIKDANEERVDCGGDCKPCKPESRIPWWLIAWLLWVLSAIMLVPILKIKEEDDKLMAQIRALIKAGKVELRAHDRKRGAEIYRRMRYYYIQIRSRTKKGIIKKEMDEYYMLIENFYDFK